MSEALCLNSQLVWGLHARFVASASVVKAKKPLAAWVSSVVCPDRHLQSAQDYLPEGISAARGSSVLVGDCMYFQWFSLVGM